MDFEVLLVEDAGEAWNVIGTTGMSASSVIKGDKTVRASKNAVLIAKHELELGNKVAMAKNFTGVEVTPNDLVITQTDELTRAKQLALNTIVNLIQQNILNVTVIESMEYLDSYMKLMNAGIFITDANREDKYFEVIEAAQTNEEPSPLPENAAFSEEQKYAEQKKKYDQAQENLKTLEKYLNGYDRLAKISYVNSILTSMREKVTNAMSIEAVNQCMAENEELIKSRFYAHDVTQTMR